MLWPSGSRAVDTSYMISCSAREANPGCYPHLTPKLSTPGPASQNAISDKESEISDLESIVSTDWHPDTLRADTRVTRAHDAGRGRSDYQQRRGCIRCRRCRRRLKNVALGGRKV